MIREGFFSDHENCLIYIGTKRILSVEDKRGKARCKFIALNEDEKNLQLYNVDGGLINDQSSKCDNLLLVFAKSGSSAAYFVEFKGRHLDHAVNQVMSSIKQLQTQLVNFSVHARIVHTKVTSPDLYSSNLIKLKKLLKTKNGNFKHAAKKLEERV